MPNAALFRASVWQRRDCRWNWITQEIPAYVTGLLDLMRLTAAKLTLSTRSLRRSKPSVFAIAALAVKYQSGAVMKPASALDPRRRPADLPLLKDIAIIMGLTILYHR